MRYLALLAAPLPEILKALNDNPIGAIALICLCAFVLLAFVIQQRR